jgi:Protein of unknown function (DUF4240)
MRGPEMDTELFWNLIEQAYDASKGNLTEQIELLTDWLAQRSVDDIADYKGILDNMMDDAYDAGLWDAAIIINCGCSEDGFCDFRGWLIAHGRAVYEKARVDPEILVDLVAMDEWADDELFLYVPEYAYERKTGEDLPAHLYRKESPELRGTSWPEETRKERFPKLSAKFANDRRWSMLP